MDKIIIKNTCNADSRTMKSNATLDDVKIATEEHIHDVQKGMKFFAEKLIEAGKNHDHTKLENFEKEYGALVMSRVMDDEFKANPWWSKHVFGERHHVNIDFKADCNLIDIFEHICDDVMSGRGRAGHLTSAFMDIDPKLLYLAYWNTVRMLDNVVQVSNKPLK
ncbi:MAG: hypothetical protein IJH63_00550 [Methanobrevibacter sp.]|nr:hypothetical protein [Methanosphaera sp.]MBR0369193.1 hypothetical protein [Methanobrevibacter sp.]